MMKNRFNMPAFFNKKIFRIGIIILLMLWIPTIIMLFLGGKNNFITYEADKSGKIIIINENGNSVNMDVEDFIPCALVAQIDIDSEEELLKTFTVILRTYINKVMDDKDSIDVAELKLPYISYEKMKDSYKGEFTEKYNKLMKAVHDTSGEMIYYKDELIVPYFHGVSSGMTRNGTDVAKIGNKAYLKSVASEDNLSEQYFSMKYYTKEEFVNKLVAYRESIIISKENPMEVISIIERDAAGYVKNIQLGSTLLTGDEFMECMELASPDFEVEEADGKIRIMVKGNGHGLGLSVYGAKNMAANGKSYKEIIGYYYTGVGVK